MFNNQITYKHCRNFQKNELSGKEKISSVLCVAFHHEHNYWLERCLVVKSKSLLIGARWENRVALYFQLVTSVPGTWGPLPRDDGGLQFPGGKEGTGTPQNWR